MKGFRLNKSITGVAAVFTIVLVSLSIGFAYAQYETQQTTDVVVPSTGVFHADETGAVGVSYDIAGTPGATGTVSTAVYNGNPQPDAAVPSGVALNHFVVVTFNMDPIDFQSANITIRYSDADVQGIDSPYALYKYIPENNSFVQLPTVFDSVAKTLTVTVTSTTDPLFAIGGVSHVDNPTASTIPTWLWGSVVVFVVIIVVGVLLIKRRRTPSVTVLSPNTP